MHFYAGMENLVKVIYEDTAASSKFNGYVPSV